MSFSGAGRGTLLPFKRAGQAGSKTGVWFCHGEVSDTHSSLIQPKWTSLALKIPVLNPIYVSVSALLLKIALPVAVVLQCVWQRYTKSGTSVFYLVICWFTRQLNSRTEDRREWRIQLLGEWGEYLVPTRLLPHSSLFICHTPSLCSITQSWWLGREERGMQQPVSHLVHCFHQRVVSLQFGLVWGWATKDTWEKKRH